MITGDRSISCALVDASQPKRPRAQAASISRADSLAAARKATTALANASAHRRAYRDYFGAGEPSDQWDTGIAIVNGSYGR
jgi:hypothetical protein